MSGPLFQESDFATQARLVDIDFQTFCRYPEEFNARQIQAAYYAMIELIDDNVGRMLDALGQTGQRDNTVVIFMSDHGECLGDHGLVAKGWRTLRLDRRPRRVRKSVGRSGLRRRQDALDEAEL